MLPLVSPAGKRTVKTKPKEVAIGASSTVAAVAAKLEAIVPGQPAKIDFSSQVDVDSLTISEAKELWKYLNIYFGGR